MDTSPVAEKVPELWFNDADCIFQAGAKLFRVHRSILSARSPIFNDMFSVPHPDNEQTTRGPDSYAHIHLPDDEKDVYYFFLAIFDAAFFESPPSEQPIYVITSILRLAHKYEVVFLKRRAVAHLNRMFPTTWNAWKDLPNLFPPAALEERGRRSYDLFPLLELANTAEIPWIIPAICHTLSRYPLPAIFQLDGWAALDKVAQEKFLASYVDAKSAAVAGGGWLVDLPAYDCEDDVTCKDCASLCYGQDLETVLEALLSQMPMIPKFCGTCLPIAKESHNDAGQEYWDALPVRFDLPPWQQLEVARVTFDISTQ